MDSSLPVAVPPPYKSRRGWLIAFGVVELLMACLFLLVLLLSFYDQFPHFLTLIWVGTLVIATLLLVFILYTRKFLPSEEQA